MLWIINGLIYGFFSALYTMVNQHRRFNGYVLGIWRGFGISLLFFPFLFLVPPQTDWHNWTLLILQGIFIGIYDSHLFFASAKYGAGTTARLMVLSVLATTIIWWILTPQKFVRLFDNGSVFITLLLALSGFSICYWYMLKSKVTRQAFEYMLPAVLALAGMSAATKEIALMGQNIWSNILYYLVVATFVSGCYNMVLLFFQQKPKKNILHKILAPEIRKTGLYIIGFSAILIAAKTMAMRLAPNPGYVAALLLTSPLFVFALSPPNRRERGLSAKAGWAMLFFLAMIMILVNGNFNIDD